MPFYTAITREGTVSAETKAKIAEEITRIHTTVMKVLRNFVRVVFLSFRRDLALPVESRPLRHRSIVYCEMRHMGGSAVLTIPNKRRLMASLRPS